MRVVGAEAWVIIHRSSMQSAPNIWVKADRGDSGSEIELRNPEGDPDPVGDLSPPPSAYPERHVPKKYLAGIFFVRYIVQ